MRNSIPSGGHRRPGAGMGINNVKKRLDILFPQKYSLELDQVYNQFNKVAAETQIHENYMIIRADRKYYKLNYDDLIYIEGQKAYVTFFAKQQQITALVSLKELEEKLPPDRFVRIHKSFIVAINRIQSLEGNSIEIARKNLPIGKNYRNNVDKIFKL